MKPFLDENFLLQNTTAERLFHEYAKHQPIIDYHNHLPPDEIANDINFSTITDIWLNGDHYKWRAMRANGIDESYISGAANEKEKFLRWAETVPYTMRNPLYHWTHMELQRYFGIQELLNLGTASAIYAQTNADLQTAGFSVKSLLQKMNVEVICTTDCPSDDLSFHKKEMNGGQGFKMLPTFRPDKFMNINDDGFLKYIEKLENITGGNISTADDLLAALENRIAYFNALGCQLSDHGLPGLKVAVLSDVKLDAIFKKRKKEKLNNREAAFFQMEILFQLAKMYHQRKWTMQLHLGPIRNNNFRLFKLIGADSGCDSIGDYSQAEGLSYFLNRLDAEEKLPKTILYNLNPSDNELFATMAGNFNDGTVPGKIQWGSAWWFLDQKDGMEKQLNTLSNMGLLSRFIGMLTDSRSFLSFPRHEYFRRILCNLIGRDVHNGELPNDVKWLGQMVENICYKNAKMYFKF
ncbi:MAG: glucuronate isomerase [Bacteroidota bacterium]